MITRVHFKSSNSSGFNPILQGFYKMICEIVVSKTGAEFSWFLSFKFLKFLVKDNFLEPKNYRKLNISRPIYFLKFSAHRFVGLICTNKLEGFFFRKYCFQGLGAFFTTAKTTNLDVIFFLKKLMLNVFSRVVV